MKISYNWLKQYINTDLDAPKVSELLTDCGLEVESTSTFQSIKGGLEGLVIGEVLTKEKHPDADKLNLTTVNIGTETPLNIVCGAPNVEAGQKVVVAPIGTTIYPVDGDSLKMKKAKIRGQESEGMICAEDEIGLGNGHDGIMVLDSSVTAGVKAKDFFDVENDVIFEIGLTPNRADGMSHYGVARDLKAVFNHLGDKKQLIEPKLDELIPDNSDLSIEVDVKNTDACPRYAGITLTNITVKESPTWLKNKLLSIGLSPINNVVDVTNYVLHELGQPLHAFDAAQITGNKVVVKNADANEKFTTLDEVERTLLDTNLMICNAKESMCIAGVFGGIKSGVSNSTTSIFLESAYFNPVSVRKTAKSHGLNTDASFRFERGVDPSITAKALQRAVHLLKDVAGAKISSELIDIYPIKIEDFTVKFSLKRCNALIGKELPKETVLSILDSLDIQVKTDNGDELELTVPAYRTDVQREVDVIEEVLRIYGYNNIEIPEVVASTPAYAPNPNKEKVQNRVSDFLVARGFSEGMNNSLTSLSYLQEEKAVKILNPLSNELDGMRQTLLIGGLENIAYNINRKQSNIKLFEFGNTYFKNEDKYTQQSNLALWITGNKTEKQWNNTSESVDFFNLKSAIHGILEMLGVTKPGVVSNEIESNDFAYGLSYKILNKAVVEFGAVSPKRLTQADIEQDVYFATFNWDNILSILNINKTVYKPVSKFPEVKRDLSLLINETVSFKEIEQIARKTEKKLLKSVNIFDVYQGKNLEAGKKSYAVKFVLQNEDKTLTDKEIDKVINKIQQNLETQVGAQLR